MEMMIKGEKEITKSGVISTQNFAVRVYKDAHTGKTCLKFKDDKCSINYSFPIEQLISAIL